MPKTTFYLTVLSFFYCLIITPLCTGALLVWDRNTEDDLAGYNVYYGASPANFTAAVDVGDVTALKLDDLNFREDVTYHIAVTAYDRSNNESTFSSAVVFSADDGISYSRDNCPDTYNPDQEDTYPPQGNDLGDVCDCEGNFDCDFDVDGADLQVFLVDVGRSQYNDSCTNTDPCNGDFNCDGGVGADDVTKFIEDVGRSRYNNPCPECVHEDWCTY